jgi:hypothetical protein
MQGKPFERAEGDLIKMEELLNIIGGMDPETALAEIAKALGELFATLGEEARTRFLPDLVGESQGDKVSSLVHL